MLVRLLLVLLVLVVLLLLLLLLVLILLLVLLVLLLLLALRSHSGSVEGVLQTAAPFQDKRIAGMLVALTAYRGLAKPVLNRQFGRALPLHIVTVASANFTAVHHVHVALGLVLGITTNTLQLGHS